MIEKIRRYSIVQRIAAWIIREQIERKDSMVRSANGRLGGLVSSANSARKDTDIAWNHYDNEREANEGLRGSLRIMEKCYREEVDKVARLVKKANDHDVLHEKYCAELRTSDSLRKENRELSAAGFSIWSLLPEENETRQMHGYVMRGGEADRYKQLTRSKTVHISGKTEDH